MATYLLCELVSYYLKGELEGKTVLIYVMYLEKCLAINVIIFVFEKQSIMRISDSLNASIYNGLTSD